MESGTFETTDEDILERLTNNANDEHRNYIYPDQARAILDLIARKDKEISELEEALADDSYAG